MQIRNGEQQRETTGIDRGILGRCEKSFFLALLLWQVLRVQMLSLKASGVGRQKKVEDSSGERKGMKAMAREKRHGGRGKH